MSKSFSLPEVPFNHDVKIESVAGERNFRRRLMEMGMVPGTTVRVISAAPMGDPLTIELRCSRLSLRRSEAAQVSVRA